MCCNTFIKIYVGMGIIDQKRKSQISLEQTYPLGINLTK